jgi:geranylgeranyl diphosphate synthase, type I
MTLAATFETWLPRIEAEMLDVVNTCWTPQPATLNTMLLYHLGFADASGASARISAGKRVRPMLVLLGCQACGGTPEQALPAAAGVELLHNFSLIHDDIEDGDELRRGRPTLWKQWGVPQAINSGDTMFAMAHLALMRCAARGVAPDRVLRALQVFGETNVHLTVGQHLDIGFENRGEVSVADYMTMIAGKTGALIKAAVEIGAILGGGNEGQINALAEFGRCLGLSFQLQDDVLGIWGDPAKTGKAGSDLVHRKKTLPVIFAAERDPAVRARYFGAETVTETDAAELRERITAAGGRAHAEAAAEAAYARGMEALASLLPAGPAAQALDTLARSLLGRTA